MSDTEAQLFARLKEESPEFRRLAALVEKTAGEQERRAFQFLDEYVAHKLNL